MPAQFDAKVTSAFALSSVRAGAPDHNLGVKILENLPVFLYLLADNYTFQYSNRFFKRQFEFTEGSTPCYKVMRGRSTPCNPCPARKVFKEKTEQVLRWQDAKRGQFYEIHIYPYWIAKDKLLVLGLGLAIDQEQKKGMGTGQTLHNQKFLRICCHCKNIHDEQSNSWQQIENYFGKKDNIRFSHGICPECLVKFYPGVVNVNR